jgi:hypothetical protein
MSAGTLLPSKRLSSIFPAVNYRIQITNFLSGLVFIEIEGAEHNKISETGNSADAFRHEDVKLFSVWDSKVE